MKWLSVLGLRMRIVIALAVVMGLFIVITELSVSQLVRVAMSRHSAVVQADGSTEDVGENLDRDLLRLRRLVLFYMIIGAAVAIILGSWAVTRLVIRPMSRITKAVEQVSDGKFETQLPIAGAGELIRLGVSFNRMTATLREQRAQLKSRLSELEKSSSDLKAVQDRLIRAAKLASVGTLAAGVAHEIGNPLAGVLGLLDALEEESDKETSTRYRKLMREEIRRIDRIINDLLIYARPAQSGAIEGVFTTLEEVVEHVHALLSAQKLFDRVEISADLSGGPWSVSISRDDLTQILINLLLNAAQAMENKGKITLNAERISEWRPGLGVIAREAVRISITDNGPGISAEFADQIFDPFFSHKTVGQGSGLGLAICQSICERAGGEITLDREYHPGSRFLLTILARSN
ncbi:MAG: HAMP domain-containing protein [Proteobacteria bacterium]|nr:HAMP domain-containing protein [Pseudomonadota bacterium]